MLYLYLFKKKIRSFVASNLIMSNHPQHRRIWEPEFKYAPTMHIVAHKRNTSSSMYHAYKFRIYWEKYYEHYRRAMFNRIKFSAITFKNIACV